MGCSIRSPKDIPSEFIVRESDAFKAPSLSLSAVKIHKAIRPDFIPNRIVKEFVQELAPVFRDIHNLYLRATSLML